VIPGCAEGCPNEQTSEFSPNPLNHQGTGQTTSSVTLPVNNADATFTVSGLDARLNGNPSKRYIDEVTISYNNGGGTVTYGTFRGDVQSSVSVSLAGTVVSVTVALRDAYDGNTGSETISVSMSSVLSCPQGGLQQTGITPGGEVQVYPNPTTGEFFVRWEKAPASATIRIYNALGEFLGSQSVSEVNVARVSLASLGIVGNQVLFVSIKEDGAEDQLRTVILTE
jgi:hypothetical protein